MTTIRVVDSKWKYLVLLAATVLLKVAHPLIAHRSLIAAVVLDIIFGLICVHVLFVVFESRWQRQVAFGLILAVLASDLAAFIASDRGQAVAAAVFHAAVVAFLGFAVAVILRNIFRKGVIRGDDVLGALAGYLLAAVAWGHLYGLTYVLAPDAFAVSPEIQWRLSRLYLRQSLFDYLSLMTLTGLGYADIRAFGPPAFSLQWLEAVFGQFYMAVVVAQLVGLKLARSIRGEEPESGDNADAALR